MNKVLLLKREKLPECMQCPGGGSLSISVPAKLARDGMVMPLGHPWCPELGTPRMHKKMHTAYWVCLLPQIQVPLVEKCMLRRKNREAFTSGNSKASSLLGETHVVTRKPQTQEGPCPLGFNMPQSLCPGAAVTKHCRLGAELLE